MTKQTVAVFGASGAIGSAFLKAFANSPAVDEVYAFSRKAIPQKSNQVLTRQLDLTLESSIAEAVQSLPLQLEFSQIIVATGVLHEAELQPEKSFKDLSAEQMRHVFDINTIGPALIAKYFLPRIRQGSRAIFAVLSARVGSISDNHLGGWYSYRASKAALNMLIKTLSIEAKWKYKEAVIVGLHPGTVQSYLSSPFQKNVPEAQLFQPEESVSRLLQVLAQLTEQDSGKCFAYDGVEVSP